MSEQTFHMEHVSLVYLYLQLSSLRCTGESIWTWRMSAYLQTFRLRRRILSRWSVQRACLLQASWSWFACVESYSPLSLPPTRSNPLFLSASAVHCVAAVTMPVVTPRWANCSLGEISHSQGHREAPLTMAEQKTLKITCKAVTNTESSFKNWCHFSAVVSKP